MKKSITLIGFIALIAIANSGFSQIKSGSFENELQHSTMSNSFASAKQQASAIASDTSKSSSDKLKNTEDILKKLDAAKQSHESIKNTIPANKKVAAQKLNTVIETHHAAATKYATSLEQELKKPTPDNVKVKDYVQKLTTSVNEMEKAHQSLKTLTR